MAAAYTLGRLFGIWEEGDTVYPADPAHCINMPAKFGLASHIADIMS